MEKTRFSLLLLEPGEIYFEDFSASLFSPTVTEDNFEALRQLGRLKLCSKSLVFDPQDFVQPILKIPLQNCIKITRGQRSWITGEDNVIQVECECYTEMLEGNVIAAYNFKQGKTKFLFLLNYAKVDDCLSQILQLKRASTLLPPEQCGMIAAIVFSRQSRVNFDTKWLEDIYEKVIVETQANKISPLVVNPGRVVLTCSRIYFQPYNNVESYPVLKINLKNITRIIRRRFLLKQVGIEIFFKSRSGSEVVDHFYFVLKSKEDRDKFYESILQQHSLSPDITEQEVMTLKWQNRAISTYEYLLYLNSLADRSFNDLTQYPVFPWVISDYTSKSLNLNDSKCYRDLTKPVGALNKERLQRLKERTQEMPEPKFLYGSHYSAPGFVIFYLVRKYPHYMLCLQNGRFDHPDRMFNSIADVWRNVISNMSDFKELTPEFYDVSQGGDFLLNTYGVNFGYRCDGVKVHDVQLPPWAESASDFVTKLREALESEYVSENVHHWIDLIFGYKQRGEESIKADNVFYYLCYEGAVDIDSVKDFNEKHALEVQIMEFGQIPKQIFKVPHPPRLPVPKPTSGLTPLSFSGCSEETDVKGVENLEEIRVIGQHKDAVNSVAVSTTNKFVLSSSKDSTVKMFSIDNEKQMRSFHLNTAVISCCILLPDDNVVVIGTYDDQILVYDINFGRTIDSIIGHEDAVTSLCWGATSQCLISSSWDCTIKVWCNIFHGDKWHRLKVTSAFKFDLDARITCSVINSDNSLVGGGTEEGGVTVINIKTNTILLKRTAHSKSVSAVSFSPDSRKLISCASDGSFKVYDLFTGMEVYSKVFPSPLLCSAWDGLSLLLGSNSGILYVWDLIEVKLVKEIICQGKNISCISVSENRKIVITGEDKTVVDVNEKLINNVILYFIETKLIDQFKNVFSEELKSNTTVQEKLKEIFESDSETPGDEMLWKKIIQSNDLLPQETKEKLFKKFEENLQQIFQSTDTNKSQP